MKSDRTRKLGRGLARRVRKSTRWERGAEQTEQAPIDELFDLPEGFGWEQMVERIRRGAPIRGRSL